MIFSKIHKKLIGFLLIIIFISLFIFKVYRIPIYGDEDAIFSGNSALKYRYARMIALSGKIQSFDRQLGFPDGFSVKSKYPYFMESFIGHLYRILPNSIPFHIYLLILMSLYSSIILFPVYLISLSIWEEKKLSIISTFIVAVTLATSKSIINIEFRSLDFVLPFILFHLYFYIKVKKMRSKGIEPKRSLGYDLISGALLFVTFSSYELAPLYILLFALNVWIITQIEKKIDISFIILSLVAIMAGFTLPNLFGTYFLYSIPMLIVYSLLISFLIRKRRPWIMPLTSIIFIAMITLLTQNGVIKEPCINEFIIKTLKVIGSKLISIFKFGSTERISGWENLFIWNNSLKTHSFKNTLLSYGLSLPIGLYGLFLGFSGWIRGHIKPQEQIIILFAVFFLLMYPFVSSIQIIVSLILAILLIYVIKKFKSKSIIIILMIAIPNIFILYISRVSYSKVETNYQLQVIKFIRNETDTRSPILSNCAYSPIFLSYSNRPISINPLDISENNIKKIREFEHKLYLSEKDFYKFCSKNKIRYFVYHKDMLLDKSPTSLRYRTNNLKISKTSPVYFFHFEPQALREFILVFSNPSFRVYEVHYADIKSKPIRMDYIRVYDLNKYNLEELGIK